MELPRIILACALGKIDPEFQNVSFNRPVRVYDNICYMQTCFNHFSNQPNQVERGCNGTEVD
jgi:hypothetical protein